MDILKRKKSENVERSGVLDEYSNKVFRLVVLIVPIFFICGNATMTLLHYIGWYPAINDIALWISNSIDTSYMVIALYLVKTSYNEEGLLIPQKLFVSKVFLLVAVVIQWNLNSYVCPFSDFWAFAPLFVIVHAFFFDVKFVSLSTIMILLSMGISWIINGENLLPAHNDFYYLNMIFRGVGLAFTLLCIYVITWFGKVFIIEAVEMKAKSSEYEREARMKSDFLANMSHEIRTPMNAVIGMAEIAMREKLPHTAMDCLAQIQKSGRNLLNIINDILDYSKIESGKMEIIPERYEPISELNDIANILTTRIGEKQLELYVVTDKEIPHALYGDAMRIRQILINLTNNAIKFTPSGRVGVIVNCENKVEIAEDGTEEKTVVLTYHVKDTGIGIREEDLEKLFVSFQQVDSRRNRSVEGTGLGLAISQKLVECMGGTIGVNSVYGEGSDFWFSIPQKVLEDASDLHVHGASRKCAVILDKDPSRAQAFTEEMEKLGIEKGFIEDIKNYKHYMGHRDFLVFAHRDYNDEIREFLENHRDVTGIMTIDFNSTFKSDMDNLYTLRCPITTHKMVKLLNDETDDTQSFESEEAYSISFTAPKAKILIVDDNEINITIAEGLLSPMRMQIDSALSGREAIEKIEKEDYDIVLMDHMMPDMDGIDTTKIIRGTLKGADELVIIALSANAVEEARNMFFEVGMNDFVAKPIDIKELSSAIKKWLPEDKIEKGVPTEEMQEEEVDTLDEFDMLDTKSAIASLGSTELFRKIVGEYYRSGQTKHDEILKAYQDGDIKDYTIKVHALKSSSRQIGALRLGDMAEALERAGKNDDMAFIKENTESALASFKGLLSSMAPIFEEEKQEKKELPVLPEEVMKELLNKLSEACDNLDMDGMEEVQSELKKYDWPAEIDDHLFTLFKSIDDLDVGTCEAIIEKLMGEE
jgi:signal transduction histidine kinase/response regulator of citrate/malate metabolism